MCPSPARRAPVSLFMLLVCSHSKVDVNIPIDSGNNQGLICWSYDPTTSSVTLQILPLGQLHPKAELPGWSAGARGHKGLGEGKVLRGEICRHNGSPGRWEAMSR